MKPNSVGAYIFLCSSDTQDECFEKNLFGATPSYQTQVKKVFPGDKLLLYNYNSLELHGLFEATSESAMNIEHDAWTGKYPFKKYPFQVRVKRIEEFHPIYRRDFEETVNFRRAFPQAKLRQDQMEIILRLFQGTESLPQDENLFRKENSPTKVTEDGHRVRSLGELTIDNWLFNKRLCHGYERKVPIAETMYCDWCFPLPGSGGFVYMEFWGMEDQKYQERRNRKIELYRKYHLKVIQLDQSCLDNLDDTLPDKLRTYFPDHSF